ncbi:recombinase family protein [Oricola sp.]|uniref:recombinase family protein n=1 Tax=Oricola sp. TaxID=1979950 RepID=UPI0025EB5E0F|nr:recombinase family protein [Oricola sp.]MCI5074006.1 recombinase family protein [Oricola sp.]
MKKIRCAIYTRKSSEEGLEQEFNSLHAQREACVSYITSQKHEGWVLLPDHYDDGGISGGTLERAGLQRLLRDVDEGLVDQIVVYKIDRLTRSLADFAKLVERLDAAEASFVSVTQSFNTATSMGRLTLNVLLSFAQFEREVTAERIRDKIAASKKKGLWMGGNVPLGYEPDGRTLKIVEDEARTVRTLFDLYLEHGSVKAVKQQADRIGLRTKARGGTEVKPSKAAESARNEPVSIDGATPVLGSDEIVIADCSDGQLANQSAKGTRNAAGNLPFCRSHIHHILANPIYAGRIRHRGQVYDGQHAAIIDPAIFDDVQQRLMATAGRGRGQSASGSMGSSLTGKLFDETGDRLTPTHANKKGRRYRYYASNRMIVGDGNADKSKAASGWRLPARSLEQQLSSAIQTHFRNRLPVDLLIDSSVDDIGRIRDLLDGAASGKSARKPEAVLSCIQQATITPGKIEIALDGEPVAAWLSVQSKAINSDAMSFSVPFQFRKRGVETKLIIGNDQGQSIDETLIRNIAKAHQYYNAIKHGQTFEEIAASESLSKRRILQVIDLAFLAPDIVKSIMQGDQPIGLTAKRLGQNPLPSDWQAQRRIVATL